MRTDNTETLMRRFTTDVTNQNKSAKNTENSFGSKAWRIYEKKYKNIEELVKLLGAFEKSIHGAIEINFQTNQNNKFNKKWENETFNPLRFESLLGEALTRFEACNGYDEAHKSLQQQAVDVLERIYTRRDIRIKEIAARIKVLEQENRKIGSFFIKKTPSSPSKKLKIYSEIENENIITVLDDFFEDNFAMYSGSSTGQTIPYKWKRSGYAALLAINNLNRTVKGVENYSHAYEEMMVNKDKVNYKIDFLNTAIRKHRVEKMLGLERDLEKAEKALANEIENAYLDSGPLDFIPRFKILRDYYITDFKSAYERLIAAIYGLSIVHPEIKIKIDEKKPKTNKKKPKTNEKTEKGLNELIDEKKAKSLSELTVLTRQLLDSVERQSHKGSIATIRIPYNQFANFDINSHFNKKTFLRKIECLSYKSVKQPVHVEIVPKEQTNDKTSKKYQPMSLYLSPQPPESRIINDVDTKPIHNTKKDSSWTVNSTGQLDKTDDLEFVVTVVIYDKKVKKRG